MIEIAEFRPEEIDEAIEGLDGLQGIIAPFLRSVNKDGMGEQDVQQFVRHLTLAKHALIAMGDFLEGKMSEKEPPNTPLTLEELREICGKPVYIAGNFDDDNLDCSGWKVVKRIYDDEFIEFTDGIWLSLSRNYFGVDWRAYSCEPGGRPREGEST